MKAKILAFASWTLIALLVVAALVVAVPRLLGGTTLTVLTGSMQPAINPGDVVAVIPTAPADLSPGDVVTFQPNSGDPMLITHRIIAVQGTSTDPTFITRGDANSADDEEIFAEQVQGCVLYVIPYIGWVNNIVGPAAPMLVIAAAVALIIAGGCAAFAPTRLRPRPLEEVSQ